MVEISRWEGSYRLFFYTAIQLGSIVEIPVVKNELVTSQQFKLYPCPIDMTMRTSLMFFNKSVEFYIKTITLVGKNKMISELLNEPLNKKQ